MYIYFRYNLLGLHIYTAKKIIATWICSNQVHIWILYYDIRPTLWHNFDWNSSFTPVAIYKKHSAPEIWSHETYIRILYKDSTFLHNFGRTKLTYEFCIRILHFWPIIDRNLSSLDANKKILYNYSTFLRNFNINSSFTPVFCAKNTVRPEYGRTKIKSEF